MYPVSLILKIRTREEQQGHKVVPVISMEFDLFFFEINKMYFVEKFKKLLRFQNCIMIKLAFNPIPAGGGVSI